jgi:hypothetical protein
MAKAAEGKATARDNLKLVVLICLLVVLCAIGFFYLFTGDSGNLRLMREVACLPLFILACVYAFLKLQGFKITFAALEVLAAIANTYYQVGRIADDPSHSQFYDRLVFIVAGIAVMGNGLKKFLEAAIVMRDANRRSSGSSATPTLDLPAPVASKRRRRLGRRATPRQG